VLTHSLFLFALDAVSLVVMGDILWYLRSSGSVISSLAACWRRYLRSKDGYFGFLCCVSVHYSLLSAVGWATGTACCPWIVVWQQLHVHFWDIWPNLELLWKNWLVKQKWKIVIVVVVIAAAAAAARKMCWCRGAPCRAAMWAHQTSVNNNNNSSSSCSSANNSNRFSCCAFVVVHH